MDKKREKFLKALKRIHKSVLETLKNDKLRKADKDVLLQIAQEILTLTQEVSDDAALKDDKEKSFWEIVKKFFKLFF
jgi:hypothetical protein